MGLLNRRQFLSRFVATASVFGVPGILRSAAPNSLLQVASIGVGGMSF